MVNDHTKVVSEVSSARQQHATLQGLLQNNKDDLRIVLKEKEALETVAEGAGPECQLEQTVELGPEPEG